MAREDRTTREAITRVIALPVASVAAVVAFVGWTQPEILTTEYDGNGRQVVEIERASDAD